MIKPNKRLQQIMNPKMLKVYSTASDKARRIMNLWANLDAKDRKTAAARLKAYAQRMN